jgi:lipoprotein-anchoring transpeptidase ErfK/SrfK
MVGKPVHARPGGRSRLGVGIAIVAAVAIVAGGATTAAFVISSKQDSPPTANAPLGPFKVVDTTPTVNATGVASAATVTVTFSQPVNPNGPMPSLSPAVPGAWSLVSPTEVEFVASEPMVPGSQENLLVPGGSGGVTSSGGTHLATSSTVAFTVAPGSLLRAQQLLAELGYLPLTFTPTTPMTSPTQEADVQQGTFAWRWANQPSSLTSLWTPGTMNVITKGALVTFEDQHNLKTDGDAGPQVWTALLAAAEAGQSDTHAYPYVYVSQTLPQTVTVYQNGAVAYSTLANTGVQGAPTDNGTFTVYERFTSATMSGTNPDGSTYSDPGIPWISYFNGGDALHGFVRSSYGWPQSDGCVEMPVSNAQVVYPMTPIGTLVTVVA